MELVRLSLETAATDYMTLKPDALVGGIARAAEYLREQAEAKVAAAKKAATASARRELRGMRMVRAGFARVAIAVSRVAAVRSGLC